MAHSRIGGGVTSRKFTAIFVLGTLIGTTIRIGMWVLPSDMVDAVIDRL